MTLYDHFHFLFLGHICCWSVGESLLAVWSWTFCFRVRSLWWSTSGLRVCRLVLSHQRSSPVVLPFLPSPCCFCLPLGQHWRRVLSRSPEHIRSQLVQRKRAESGVWPSAQHGSPGESLLTLKPYIHIVLVKVKFAQIADVYVRSASTHRSMRMFCASFAVFNWFLTNKLTYKLLIMFNVGKHSEHEHYGLGLRQNGAARRLARTYNSWVSANARWVILTFIWLFLLGFF